MTSFFKKLIGKKEVSPLREVQDVINNLRLLAEAETNISVFYRLCASAAGNEANLWGPMATARLQHAENLNKMSTLIAKEPHLYRSGYSINPASIRLFSLYMRNLAKDMEEGKIPREKLSLVALEIENYTVELNIGKIIEIVKDEYNDIARNIDSESRDHRNAISRREAENA